MLADASLLAQGVPTYHDTKVRERSLTRADGPLDGADANQQPSLWAMLKSALRIAAMAGVAVVMVRLLLDQLCEPPPACHARHTHCILRLGINTWPDDLTVLS